jgi:hypothetical protein
MARKLSFGVPDFTSGWLLELQLWGVSHGARMLGDLEPYEPMRVAGVVERVRIAPLERYLAILIGDGTGWVSARWAIERTMPQLSIVPGRRVVLDGIASVGSDGELEFVEPSYRHFPAEDLA